MIRESEGLAAMPGFRFLQNPSFEMAEQKLVKIKLLRSVSGYWEGEGFSFGAGAEVEVPSGLALDLCREGGNAILAEPAKSTAAAKQPNKETR